MQLIYLNSSAYYSFVILSILGLQGTMGKLMFNVLHWIMPWLKRGPDLSHLKVIVYTRNGCHLCESALEKLNHWQSQCGFSLEFVDVDKEEELQKRFGEQVPVVTVNGKVRFRGCVNEVLLKRLLLGEARKAEKMI